MLWLLACGVYNIAKYCSFDRLYFAAQSYVIVILKMYELMPNHMSSFPGGYVYRPASS